VADDEILRPVAIITASTPAAPTWVSSDGNELNVIWFLMAEFPAMQDRPYLSISDVYSMLIEPGSDCRAAAG